ncbi:MAG: hypothetical protein KF744_04495 [Taibaiella sp.]|nr:hypothetical protein [Taibaiella sp.]
MKFWEHNGSKVSFIAASSFAGSMLCLLALGVREHLSFSRIVMFTMLLSGAITGFFVLRGISFYRTMRRIIEDRSSLSVLPLFREGYNVLLHNEHNRIFFTTERIKGDISGMPVTVAFSQGSPASWPALVFSFYPLHHATLGTRTSMYLSFKLNLRNRLKKDIKPEVLRFVNDLREKGYSSAEYANYFVTAN